MDRENGAVRVVVQRVSRASVAVDGQVVVAIGHGLLALVGVEPDDGTAEVEALAGKLAGLRVFADEHGKMNLSVSEVAGEVLVVSQFTLLADLARGRRPSFTGAAPPDHAEPLVEAIAASLGERGIPTGTGVFGAAMEVELVNDGPVTLVIEARDGRVR